MSGRGAQLEDFVAAPGQGAAVMGLWADCTLMRLGGGRGPVQCLRLRRFVLPTLIPSQHGQIADGRQLLDQMTRNFIREHLGYRYAIHPGGGEAVAQPSVTASIVTQ
jgi:hypothetical protein